MTTQAIANYLENGYWNNLNEAEPHHWATGKNKISYNVNDLNSNAQILVEEAFDRWDEVMNMGFAKATGSVDITVTNGDLDNGGGVTRTSYSGNNSPSLMNSAEITLDNELIDSNTTETSGAYQTILHEIGHALGLGHAGPYDAGNNDLPDGGDFSDAIFDDDSWQKSVMSYFNQSENPNTNADQASPITPQIADIKAIKSIYGGNQNVRDLDTQYGYGASGAGQYSNPTTWNGNNASFIIYDTGGEDTIDASNAASDQELDLRPGEFSSFGDASDVRDSNTLQDNVTIAPRVDIENAIGGSGDDELTGNGLDNELFGHEGDDTMNGNTGEDTFRFGASFRSTLSTDTDAGDTIDGGPGTDRLLLTSSDTSFDFTDAAIRSVEVIDFTADVDNQTITLESSQLSSGGTDLSNVKFENSKSGKLVVEMTGANVDLSGLSFENPHPDSYYLRDSEYFATVEGDSSDETIVSTDRADKIITGDGDDVARVKGGDDLVQSNGQDTLYGGSGNDTVDFSNASFADASIELSAGAIYHNGWMRFVGNPPLDDNPNIETLSNFDNVIGSSGGNTIRGDDGANELKGMGGADELYPNGGTCRVSGASVPVA